MTFQFSSIKVNAQSDYYFQGVNNFNENIPAPWDFLGYPIGTLHTRYDKIVEYMMELSRISDRVNVEVIGYTNEHRPQIILTITSSENYNNIENIRNEHIKITEMILNPDHNALGSFYLDDIRNGAIVTIGWDRESQRMRGHKGKYKWQDGQVIDKDGKVIMNCRPKKSAEKD